MSELINDILIVFFMVSYYVELYFFRVLLAVITFSVAGVIITKVVKELDKDVHE